MVHTKDKEEFARSKKRLVEYCNQKQQEEVAKVDRPLISPIPPGEPGLHPPSKTHPGWQVVGRATQWADVPDSDAAIAVRVEPGNLFATSSEALRTRKLDLQLLNPSQKADHYAALHTYRTHADILSREAMRALAGVWKNVNGLSICDKAFVSNKFGHFL